MTLRFYGVLGWLAAWAAVLPVGVGCQRKAVVTQTRVSLAATTEETSPFDVAMEYLNNLDQYQPTQVRTQILANLREWSRQEQLSVEWYADPMFRRLPADIKEMYSVESLSTKVFEQHDALELQQAIWLRDVARTVASQPLTDQRLRSWIEASIQDGSLSPDGGDDLSLAFRLFDWTVRNIQLDPEVEDIDIIGGERARERRDRDTLRHQYYPWENLLYGHGDWLERSRVFMLLARQLGISAVMLVAERGDDIPAQPWVTAVLVGDELYLFDTLLGIPLPGGQRNVIGRLTEYVAEPALLDELSAGLGYRISQRDLGDLVASIDATPAALSQRMKQIEVRLSGQKKVVLTVNPTPMARKLRECKHISQVEIWPFPYRGYQFFAKLREQAREALPLLAKLQQEQTPFETRGPLMRGRMLHLRGYYRGDHDRPGAVKLYMQSRLSKKELERFNIPIDQVPKESPLVSNLPEDPVQRQLVFRQRLKQGRAMALRAKDRATYWLGLIAFDRQEFKVATDYLKLNLENAESAWKHGARYNLARAYEAMGRQDHDSELIRKAIELYTGEDESPQRAGNRLRAAMLTSAD